MLTKANIEVLHAAALEHWDWGPLFDEGRSAAQ